MTTGMADFEAPWLAWTHAAWFPVLMAFGTFVADAARHRLASRLGSHVAAFGVKGGVDIASLAFGAAFAVLALWLEFGAGRGLLFYLRALLSEPSMGLVAFSLFSLARRGFGREEAAAPARRLLATVATVGIIFYPMALGIGYFDPYALGYHAWFAALVFVPALLAWWHAPLRGVAVWLTLALFAWNWQLPESDNLWDQLLDPVLFSIALYGALPGLANLVGRGFRALRGGSPPGTATMGLHVPTYIERLCVTAMAVMFLLGVLLSIVNQRYFDLYYIQEDGVLEWLTVLVLMTAAWTVARRLWRHRARIHAGRRCIWGAIAVLFVFGAGEELSWGQRLFEIKSPGFFLERNAQQETNLHNLMVGNVKINKLIFGKVLFAAFLLYLAVIVPLYHRAPRMRSWLDGWGIPVPQRYQWVGYLAAFLVVEVPVQLLSDTPERGELTEFALTMLAVLNVTHPHNRREVWDAPGRTRRGALGIGAPAGRQVAM